MCSDVVPQNAFQSTWFASLSAVNGRVYNHNDVIMGAMDPKSSASRVFAQPFIHCADQSKHQNSASTVTGLCVGNSPVTGHFPAQMASNAENVSIWWPNHYVSGDCCNVLELCLQKILFCYKNTDEFGLEYDILSYGTDSIAGVNLMIAQIGNVAFEYWWSKLA